jgi:hypothetical protein
MQFSTAVTESTVQWLLHRRMNAHQQMCWTPRGELLMLKVRCAVMNGTLELDHAIAEGRACRPFRRGMTPRFKTVSAPLALHLQAEASPTGSRLMRDVVH